MKIEVGKTYLNRLGEKVIVLSGPNDADYYQCSDDLYRYSNGRVWINEDNDDLVSEAPSEPPGDEVKFECITNFDTRKKEVIDRNHWRYEFAGRAMAELLRQGYAKLELSKTSVKYADALLEELEKESGE